MFKWTLIGLGGAAGSMLHYAVQLAAHRLAGPTFPVGTLAVNISGCMILGFLAAAWAGPLPMRDDYRIGLAVGVLGGFTTFSTFGLETFNMASHRQLGFAAANIALSCGLGLAAVWAGHRAAQWWFAV